MPMALAREKLGAELTYDDANRSAITVSCELGANYLFCRLLSNIFSHSSLSYSACLPGITSRMVL